MSAIVKRWLAHPLTRGLAIDDPSTTALRRRIVREKRGLRRLYERWYEMLRGQIPPGDGRIVELGSGAGFFAEGTPSAVTSDAFLLPGLDLVADGRALPFGSGSLRAIVMVDVFHHIPDVRQFLIEAGRCLRPGGIVAMIEPWVTPFSTIAYRHFHHEPFDPRASTWKFQETGPLSGANGALPWIVFERDKAAFHDEFDALSVVSVEPLVSMCYVLSGGVSLRSLVPDWSWRAFEALDGAMRPLRNVAALFALVVVEKARVGTDRESAA